MKNINGKNILIGFVVFLLFNCEGLIGEDGVVIDYETDERITGVMVKMESENGVFKEDLTDSLGYFSVMKFVSYGLRERGYGYNITFKKENYQTIIIDENYYGDTTTEFVPKGTKDTLVIKLLRIE